MKSKLCENKILNQHRKNFLATRYKNDLLSFKLYSNNIKDDSVFFNKKNKLSKSLESNNNNDIMITNTSSTMSNDKENSNLSLENNLSYIKIKENLSKGKFSDSIKKRKNEPQNKKRILIKTIKNKTTAKKFVICKIKNKKKYNNNISDISANNINNNLPTKSKSLNLNDKNIISSDSNSDNEKIKITSLSNINYNNKIKKNLTLIKNRTKSLFEKYDSLIRNGIYYK